MLNLSPLSPPLIQYSLSLSECLDLSIDSSNGNITGELQLSEGETCSYQVKASDGTQSILSETVSVFIGSRINLSFSSEHLVLQKGGGFQTVMMNLSRPAPFASVFRFDMSGEGAVGELSGYQPSGTIFVPQGATQLSLQFDLPAGSAFAGVAYAALQLQSGTSHNKPLLQLGLLENTVPKFQRVGAGYQHSCGISSGRLYCWGSGFNGQLGTPGDENIPRRIGILTDWTQISLGYEHTCGIESGQLYCWGSNDNGELGHTLNSGRPLKVIEFNDS